METTAVQQPVRVVRKIQPTIDTTKQLKKEYRQLRVICIYRLESTAGWQMKFVSKRFISPHLTILR